MPLVRVEVDDEAVETVRRLGGHRTGAAAVTEALRQYNQRLSRAAAYDRYFELAQERDLESAETAHQASKKYPGQ